jgi:hypothetical protein
VCMRMLMFSKYLPIAAPPPLSLAIQLVDGFPVLKNVVGFVLSSICLDCHLYQSTLFYSTLETIETRGTYTEGRRARWTQCIAVNTNVQVLLKCRYSHRVRPLIKS